MDQIRQTIAVLGEQIRQSDAYREYVEADALYHADAPLQALVDAFNKARQTLMDERAAGEKDMAKIEQAQKSMKTFLRKLREAGVLEE